MKMCLKEKEWMWRYMTFYPLKVKENAYTKAQNNKNQAILYEIDGNRPLFCV